jgi:hypothetical protein
MKGKKKTHELVFNPCKTGRGKEYVKTSKVENQQTIFETNQTDLGDRENQSVKRSVDP